MTADGQRRTDDPRHWVPVPDPTQRTIEVLEREVKAIHEKLTTVVDALEDKLNAAMTHRAEVTDSRFTAVKLQFDLIESGRIEQKVDTKAAVDAALIAQKEAVKEQTIASEKSISKSETSTTEAIKQLAVTFTASIDSVNRAVGDLKERVVGMEAQRAGAKDNTAAIIASIAVAGVIVSIVMSAITMFVK